MKTALTISKKWNHPQIEVMISNEEISLKMDIDNFKEALKQEIGSITWTFKKDTFNQMIDDAIQRIISGVKEESAKVI